MSCLQLVIHYEVGVVGEKCFILFLKEKNEGEFFDEVGVRNSIEVYIPETEDMLFIKANY